MYEDSYDDRLPLGLSAEEKAALMWKIEQDYLASNLQAIAFKAEYITFAVNFYTRSADSLADITGQYRAHRAAERRKSLAAAFLADMKIRMREREYEPMM